MDIRINHVKAEQFKKFGKEQFVFNGHDTSIYGDNTTGKTSILDAITWCLFNKNGRGETDFEVKPHGAERPIVSVEVQLSVDGEVVNLRKEMSEIWTKRRGTDTESFTGHKSVYYINDIPQETVTMFQDFINRIIDEKTFRQLTSADYFLSMKKPDMRKTLLDMAGNVTQEIVAGEDAELQALVKFMTEKKCDSDSVLKLVKQNVKAFETEQGQINPRIDEITKMMPEDRDWTKLQNAYKSGEKIIADIDEKLGTGRSAATQAKEKLEIIAGLKREQARLVEDAREAVNRLRKQTEQSKQDAERSLRNKVTAKLDLAGSIARQSAEASRLTVSLQNLATSYKKIVEQRKAIAEAVYTPVEAGAVDCPTCGQSLPAEQIEAINAKNLELFETEKAKAIPELSEQLKKLGAQGTTEKAEKDRVVASIEKQMQEKTTLEDEIKALEKTIAELADTLERNPAVDQIDMSNNAKYQDLAKKIEEAQQIAEESTDWMLPLVENKAKVKGQMEEITKLLLTKETRETYSKRIAELSERGTELSALIGKEKRLQYTVERFIRKQAEMLQEAINGLFENVQFRLFDTQINGGIADDCTPLVNGIEYKDASNSERIRANMDLIKAFQKSADTTVFCLVDNAEAATYLRKMDCQVIRLVVSEQDKGLRVVLEDESPKVIHFEEDGKGGFVSTETVKTINSNDQLDIENLFAGF